jgi:glycosyltransferase involved in cell wall biosynthesis
MISVLCSNYNSEQHIDNYLTYLNDQLLKEFEVIFVDANSTDGSLKKIKEFTFREGIKKCVIECEDKITIYEAWNKAIDKSSYDYVLNYNTDDKLFRNAFLTLSTYSTILPDVDVIYSNCLIADDKNHNNLVNIYKWKNANILKNLLEGCCVGPFPLLKKSSVIEAGMFNPEFTISGDYEMWCRMKSMGKTFVKIDEFLGVYYHNPKGVSTSLDSNRHTLHVEQDLRIRKMYS